MELHERLKEMRDRNGLTQKEVAAKLNISRSSIAKYETGAAIPDIPKLVVLCKIYDCSLDYLVGLTESPLRLNKIELDFYTNILNIFIREELINGEHPSETEAKKIFEIVKESFELTKVIKKLSPL